MPNKYYHSCYHYINYIWWTVSDMKLTAESSASLYSYIPLTSNILLTNLLSQNPQSVFLPWCKTPNFTPTQNERNNVNFVYQYMQHSKLNWSKYCLKLSCSPFQNHGPSQISSAFNISETGLMKSDSDTSQALWQKIQISHDITKRSFKNLFSKFQLLHEYTLLEKPENLNIC